MLPSGGNLLNSFVVKFKEYKYTLWTSSVCLASPEFDRAFLCHRILLYAVGAGVAGYPGCPGWIYPPGPRYPCPQPSALIYPCECLEGSDQGVKILCRGTNLASMALGLGNLAALDLPVEELTIANCSISRLYGTALFPVRARVLRIRNTPLTAIEPHAFHGINRTLQELHIEHSQIQTFPNDAIHLLGNLSRLYITDHLMTSLPTDAFTGPIIGRLERLSLARGNIGQLPPEALAPLRKLKWLDLQSNALSSLKKSQFRGLRDLETLDLSFNNFTRIDASHVSDLVKLSTLNVSHNALNELTRGAFARNTVLRVLNMSYNKIRKLDSNSFRGMRFIRRLYLSDNQMTDIGRGTFGAITRVGTIDLARNQLTKIDYQMFHQLQYVEILDVSENKVTTVEKLAFKDLFLVRINLSHNAIEKIEPGAFENCANITILDLSFNRLATFSKTAFDPTTYATELRLSFNNLTDLSQVPLHNMTGLKILNVSHNQIETIPRNTFPKLYELHTIDLSYNRIHDIWNSVFQTLFSLRSLNLSYNALDTVKGSTFGALHTLIELDLRYNNLSDLNKGSLARLASLRKLDLSHNNLQTIFQLPISLTYLDLSYNAYTEIPTEPGTWPTMNSLISLDLSHNSLGDTLRRGSFTGLLTLQHLDLGYNNITRPPWEALSDLTTLQYLRLKHNGLTNLNRGAFGRLPVVFSLDLSHNEIYNVTPRAFDGLLQLLSLNLTANKLKSIPNGGFQGLVSLRTLDLSHNSLEKIDNKTHGLLDDCLSLERVNLSHNRISFITRKTFPSNPWVPYRLREIDLSYNSIPVLTWDLTQGTSRVEKLNLSHNTINEIRKNVLGNLTALRVLDMSHNRLSSLPEEVFKIPENLTILNLGYNRLNILPIKPLREHGSRCKQLDLRGNRLSSLPYELMPLIKNGTKVLFADNPIECTCSARPIQRWFISQPQSDDPSSLGYEWKSVICMEPAFLTGQRVVQVDEAKLSCTSQQLRADPDLDLTPDVKFRDLHLTSAGRVSVTWFVTSRDDIGDFYITVRSHKSDSSSSPPIMEEDVPYSERTRLLDRLPSNIGPLQLCVLARDSQGEVRVWRASQCRPVPSTGSGNAAPSVTGSWFLLVSLLFALKSYSQNL